MSGTSGGTSGAQVAAADGPVFTGVMRYVGAVAGAALKTAYPGLQSVTVTVLAGSMNLGTDSGGGTPINIPAGVSLTWSVGDDDDSSLGLFNFQPLAGGDAIVAWTYKGAAAG